MMISDDCLKVTTSILTTYTRLREHALRGNVRACLWLTGEAQWTLASAALIARQIPNKYLAVVSDRLVEALRPDEPDTFNSSVVIVSPQRAERLLGQEFSCVIYDCVSGVNPDALGQISGLIAGGGVLIILSEPPSCSLFFEDPEKQRLTVYPYTEKDVANHFLERFALALMDNPVVTRHDQVHGLSKPSLFLNTPSQESEPGTKAGQCAEQDKFVKSATQALLDGPCAVVLTAARGRGKSAAIGMVVDEWCKQKSLPVYISAPNEKALISVYQFAELARENKRFQFHLPTDLVKRCNQGSIEPEALLVIDEAAAVPVHLLQHLAQYFTHIIFSTTTQGYEGNGQGFLLRFVSQLACIQESQGQALHFYQLSQPIRWSPFDGLEPFFNRLLLMDSKSDQKDDLSLEANRAAELARSVRPSHDHPTEACVKVSADWLVANPPILDSLFRLLTEAHYRTTPGDLRILLDSPNLHIWITYHGDEVVAACLVAEEGPLPASLVTDIWQGRRRPRGHLIPQLLVSQVGFREAGTLKVLRIIRIATRVSKRRSGHASQLIQSIKEYARLHSIDLLGAAFSATPQLLRFWEQNNLRPIRVGLQADPVTGSFSLLVAEPLSPTVFSDYEGWRSYFYAQLAFQRQDWLASMDPELYQMISSDKADAGADGVWDISKADFEHALIIGFAEHFRSYESTAFVLHRLLEQFSKNNPHFLTISTDDDESVKLYKGLLDLRVLQQETEAAVIKRLSLTGQKMLIKNLRQAAAWLAKLVF